MISSLFSRLIILFCGTLYPAYASYKAVRTKDVKEYVKWMMYWIVFAFFTCIETFTDIFISWLPFYYEVKVALVFWLLSPATKGSSTLYRKFVHPMLTRHEQEIDEYVNQAKERGYSAVLQLGSKGVNYATNVLMQTAIKTYALTTAPSGHGRGLQNSHSADELFRGQDTMDSTDNWLPRASSLSSIESYTETIYEPRTDTRRLIIREGGGNLVQTIKRSYSLSDLSEPDMHRTQDELDDVMMSSMTSSAVVMRSTATGARLLRPRNQTPVGRSGSGTRHSTGMYFTEVDVTAKNAGDFNYNIRSQDDISSGYSSAEPVSGLSRTSSMTNASKARAKSKRNELLEEMRDEVYLDNQLYFQGVRGKSSVPGAHELKIVESSESIQSQELEKVVKEVNDDAEYEAFFEALPLIEEHISEVVANYAREEKLLQHNSIEEEPFEDALFEEPKKCVSDEVDAKNIEDLSQEIQTDRSQNQTPNGSAETTDSGSPFQSKPYVHPPIDPFLLVLSASASAPDPFLPERPRPMSPSEMRETLEEIKHSFRAQLEPEPSVSASPSPSLRPKANHCKGRAPPPPLPPKKHSLSPQPDAISQTSTGSVERKSGIGQLFKNIKANVLRNIANPSQQQPEDKQLAAKETQI